MKKAQKAIRYFTIASMLVIAGCAAGREAKNQANGMDIQDTRTILDRVQPEVRPVESRFLIMGENGHMTVQEIDELRRFIGDYQRTGRGNIVVSFPNGAPNDLWAQNIVRELQSQIYAGGVEYSSMGFGPYNAMPNQFSPVVVSFNRYEVKPVECTPWTQIDPRKTADNLATPRFGCAQAANLAAMIVDPGDLMGDRREEPTGSERVQLGVDALRKGEVKQVSGSVSGGGN